MPDPEITDLRIRVAESIEAVRRSIEDSKVQIERARTLMLRQRESRWHSGFHERPPPGP